MTRRYYVFHDESHGDYEVIDRLTNDCIAVYEIYDYASFVADELEREDMGG